MDSETENMPDGSGIPRPEGISRDIPEDLWGTIDPMAQQAIASVISKKENAHREHIDRLHGKLAEINGKVDGIAAAGGGKPQEPASYKSWSDMPEDVWDRESRNALDLYDKRFSSDEEVKASAQNITTATIGAILREQARREASRAQRETMKTIEEAGERSSRNNVLVGKLTGIVGQNALFNKDNPINVRARQHQEELKEINGGEISPALEYVSFLLAKNDVEAGNRGNSGGPRTLGVDGLARQISTADDPEIAALKRKGEHAKALRLRTRKFLEAGNDPRFSRGQA